MRNGLLTVPMRADDEVPAARTGILLGAGAQGPVHLRLLRQSGIRIAIAAEPLPAQLIALRAANAAVPVEVGTRRRPPWEPLIAAAPGMALRSPDRLAPRSGPALIVHDHAPPGPGNAAGGNRPAADVRPWQCRVDVYPGWTADQPNTLATVQLAISGPVPAPDAARLATAFGLPPEMLAAVPGLPALTFALLRRGRLEYVSVEPTAAERELLAAAGAQLTAPRIAP